MIVQKFWNFQEKFRKVEIDAGDVDSLTLRPYTYYDEPVIEIVKGRIEAIHTLNMSSSTNPYKFVDPFVGV